MSVTVTELADSPKAGKDSIDLFYGIDGATTEAIALANLYAACPVIYLYDGATLLRNQPSIEPQAGPGAWKATVPYRPRKRPETGDSSYNFDTTGGTQHITQSLSTVGQYVPADQKKTPFKGAIGLTHDGVEGVDIPLPIFKWTETHYLPIATVTEAYKHLLYQMSGKINLDTFRMKARGEVRFLGAAGSQRGEEDWEITFHFEAQPNARGIPIGDIIVAEKLGWDYLWVRYADDDDPDSGRFLQSPVQANVERVHHFAFFSNLGI